MCGRFGLEYGDDFYPRFKLKDLLPGLVNNYNISPGQDVPIILKGQNGNKAQIMRWGFVPFWADDQKIGYKMFNARIETIQEKPTFRSSFVNKRCIVPASTYYEWKDEDGTKTPYAFNIEGEKYFSMAGLYSHWENKNSGKSLDTFTIITTSPSAKIAQIHDRMPVIIKKELEDLWLSDSINSEEFGEIAKASLSLDLSINELSKDHIFNQKNKPYNLK